MQATLKEPAKFDRLAARLGASESGAKAALRQRFELDAERTRQYRLPLVTPVVWGPGRHDAIGLIINRVTAVLPGVPQNWSTPVAPTKPPFLWNSPQGLWTQWRGVQQVPIERNLIETMGVFMSINLVANDAGEGLFESNAAIGNLQAVENLLERLAPPSWPEDVFGKIDRAKAQMGKNLFVPLCSGCHNVWPYAWTEPNKYGKRFVLVGLTPQSYVGTDPNQFETVRDYVMPRQLSPYMPGPFKDKDLVPTGDMYFGVAKSVLQTAIGKARIPEADMPNLLGYRELPTPRPPEKVYKAAPRDGVWSTPPFMHNGSVPNLYEMLVPAKERTKKFCRGREFDPVKVGLDTSLREWRIHARHGVARKLERRALIRGWAPGQRCHRPAADGRATLGAGRIPEVDPGTTRAGNAIRRAAGQAMIRRAAHSVNAGASPTTRFQSQRQGFTMRISDLNRALVVAAAAAPTAAFAHAGVGDGHDLALGFMHPLAGIDHVLAMIAIGVVAAQLGGRALWAVPLSFVATMTIAAVVGMVGLSLPGLEAATALSLVVLGLVILRRVKLPVVVATAMVAAFAVFHGYSHGLEMGDARSGAAFALGFVSATALLHLAGIGLGLLSARAASSRGMRFAQAGGSALAVAGVILFAGSLN